MGLSSTALLLLPVLTAAQALLQERSPYYGGYALSLPAAVSCPAGTTACDTTVAGVASCCPVGTYCDFLGSFCCPTQDNCSPDVAQAPTCASPDWVMFAPMFSGFESVCCLTGQEVNSLLVCVSPGDDVDSGGYSTTMQGNTAAPPTGTTVVQTAGATNAAGGGAAPTAASGEGTVATTAVAGTTAATQSGASQSAATAATTTKKSGAERVLVGSSVAVGGALVVLCGLLQL